MTVNEAHIQQMRQRIRSMSPEEMEEVAKEIPLTILAKEIWSRVSELCYFKANFDELAEQASKIEQFTKSENE